MEKNIDINELIKKIKEFKSNRKIITICLIVTSICMVLGTIGAILDNFSKFYFLIYYPCEALILYSLLSVNSQIKELNKQLETALTLKLKSE